MTYLQVMKFIYMKYINSKLPLLIILSNLVYACNKSDTPPDEFEINSPVIIVGSGYTNLPGGFLTSYPTFENSVIDNSNNQFALNLSNFSAVAYKNKLYGALQIGTGIIKYGLNEKGQLVNEGQTALINGHNRMAFIGDTEAWFTSSGLLSIQKINPETMTLGESIDITPAVMVALPDALTKTFKSCRDIFHRDGKLFVTLDFGLNDFTPAYDSAFVAVIDLSSNSVDAIRIKPNVKMAGDFYPYTTSMVVDGSNNLYILCVGSYGTLTDDHSKIIRIPIGTTDFDNYELDITAQVGGTCRGLTEYKKGIIYTPVLKPELLPSSGDFFVTPCYKFHKIDLNNKTISDMGLPATTGFKGHAGTTSNDTTYLPIFNDTEIAIYGYEGSTNKYFKKCDVTGGGYVQFITTLQAK